MQASHVYYVYCPCFVLFFKVEWQKVPVWRTNPTVANILRRLASELLLRRAETLGAAVVEHCQCPMVSKIHLFLHLLMLLQKQPTFQLHQNVQVLWYKMSVNLQANQTTDTSRCVLLLDALCGSRSLQPTSLVQQLPLQWGWAQWVLQCAVTQRHACRASLGARAMLSLGNCNFSLAG